MFVCVCLTVHRVFMQIKESCITLYKERLAVNEVNLTQSCSWLTLGCIRHQQNMLYCKSNTATDKNIYWAGSWCTSEYWRFMLCRARLCRARLWKAHAVRPVQLESVRERRWGQNSDTTWILLQHKEKNKQTIKAWLNLQPVWLTGWCFQFKY